MSLVRIHRLFRFPVAHHVRSRQRRYGGTLRRQSASLPSGDAGTHQQISLGRPPGTRYQWLTLYCLTIWRSTPSPAQSHSRAPPRTTAIDASPSPPRTTIDAGAPHTPDVLPAHTGGQMRGATGMRSARRRPRLSHHRRPPATSLRGAATRTSAVPHLPPPLFRLISPRLAGAWRAPSAATTSGTGCRGGPSTAPPHRAP
jgi:IS5 family transposase